MPWAVLLSATVEHIRPPLQLILTPPHGMGEMVNTLTVPPLLAARPQHCGGVGPDQPAPRCFLRVGVSPRNSKSGHQLIQNKWGGMLSLSPGRRRTG